MSYLVFARKYRPQTFEEVVAQEHVTRTLRNALKNDRIGSGYLFTGPRGTGKTTIARILAKSVNCVEDHSKAPCGKCSSCVEITSGSSLDVLEIDAASNTGVDDIRTLRENVRYLPTSGKKRIYIIDEVHRLSASAFDALLKTLEEPPPHVMFMFATTEPLKIPETILSRTQRFDLRRVSVDELAGHLGKIAKAEKLKINDAALNLLARKADGSVRDSLSLMDQIAAFADDSITEEDVVRALGLVDRQFLMDYTDAIAESNRQKVLQLTSTIFSGGIDTADFVQELLEHLRILMILSSDPEAGEVLSLNKTEAKEYAEQAAKFTIGDLLRLVKIASEINFDLKRGLDERLLLEVAGVKMAEMESTVVFEEVLERLKGGVPVSPAGSSGQKKKLEKTAVRPPKAKTPAPSKKAEPSPPAEEVTPEYENKLSFPQLEVGWKKFRQQFKKTNPMLSSQLKMAEIRGIENNKIDIALPKSCEPSKELLSKPANLNLILKRLGEHYKANLTIKLRIDPDMEIPDPETGKKKAPRVDPAKLLESSPRLRKLVERVEGEIIGIKKVE